MSNLLHADTGDADTDADVVDTLVSTAQITTA